MQGLSLPEEPGRPALATLDDALGSTKTVLVLDNCEHAPDETSALIESLSPLGSLKIVATSQRRLDYSQEEVFQLEPLTTAEAVHFFSERANIEPSSLNSVTEAVIENIARALDGLPVALDLAAARLASLTLEELAAELRALKPYHLRSTRGLDPRHRTIGNVIAWSYSQLSPDAKRAFALASLFADGFDAQDIAAVGDDDPAVVASALEEAAELSLLMRTEFSYRMLLPIRAVASRMFAAIQQRRAIEERFAARMNDIARELWSEIASANAGAAMYRLFLRYGDFCNVLGWALKRPVDRFPMLQDIMTVMTAAWAEGGRFTEGLIWSDRLESVAERLKPAMRGKIYYVGICVAHAAGDYARMLERGSPALSAFTIAGDRLGLARSYNALAAAAFHCGQLDDAYDYAETAVQVYGQIDHKRGVAVALINQGNVLFDGRGDAARARSYFRRALELLETSGTDALIGIALGNLAEIDYTIDDYEGASHYAHAAIARFEAAASLAHIAWQHQTLGRIAMAQGLAPVAKEHLHLTCDLLRRAPQAEWIARLAEIVARLLIAVEHYDEAAAALSAAARLRGERAFPAQGFIARERAHDEAHLRELLGEQRFADASFRASAWDISNLTPHLATLLVGIGRSEGWRRPGIVAGPEAEGKPA
jgi:predicted ATPase